ncbi:MAG: hypothetical protein A2289_25645 [Deltaproteobacteria bacterium RIFOXYA12_FULL_58_15]|nr:MAG: hypothetical protein A2289_25645 [Deltaproteobacteria bacterium RIFOXYA12_FULL_58_15]
MTHDDEWKGGVFSEDLDGGRSGASLHIVPNGLRAVTNKGPELSMAFDGMQVEVGGASGHMVFCRPSDRSVTFFCDNGRFLDALGEVAPGPVASQINDLRARRGRKQAFKAVTVLAVIGVVVALVFTVSGMLHGAVRKTVDALPIEIDQKLGEVAFSAMDLGGDKVEAPIVVEGMQAIIERVQPYYDLKGMKLEIHVVDSKQVNAFALPGGYLVVYTGLLRDAAGSSQVAGVIAHEIGHVIHRHGLTRIGQSLGLVAGLQLILGDVSGVLGAAQDLLTVAAINGYSRTQESEADATAVAALHAAGLDPTSLIGFFEKQIAEQNSGAIDSEILSWVSSHPDNAERIAAMRKQITSLEKNKEKPLPIDWKKVIDALP